MTNPGQFADPQVVIAKAWHELAKLENWPLTNDQLKAEFFKPTQSGHGDLTTNFALISYKFLPAEFKTAHNLTGPLAWAQKIAAALGEHFGELGLVNSFQSWEAVAPGFINFTFSHHLLAELLTQIPNQPTYGQGNWGQGQCYEIEHTSPNPNKAMHLGHLRNNLLGMAIANLWQASGIKVIREAVDNNRGIAIAKLIWGYLKFAQKNPQPQPTLADWVANPQNWWTPAEKQVRPDKFVDQLYVQASEDFKDPAIEKKVRQLVIDWEAGDQQTWALWAKVLDFSHQGQNLTLNRLGNHWDKVWAEHEHYQQGKDLVALGLKKGIFRQLADGAILTDLSQYQLSDTIVQKADGTSLYITQDLALTKLKLATYGATKLHWVVGPEQSLALQQLFAICEQLGFAQRQDLIHLSYGYLSLKGLGKMSSRNGSVVYIDDLIDQAKELILPKISSDLSPAEKEAVAERVAIGAVKYSILKVARNTNIAFDLQTSLNVQGNSGPYLQYTYARASSVLKKLTTADLTVTKQITIQEIIQVLNSSVESNNPVLNSQLELADNLTNKLLATCYWYPETVKLAAEQNEPSMVATYLFDLAQQFNTFYHQAPILSAEGHLKAIRVLLTQSVSQILAHGLELLGIAHPDKM